MIHDPLTLEALRDSGRCFVRERQAPAENEAAEWRPRLYEGRAPIGRPIAGERA